MDSKAARNASNFTSRLLVYGGQMPSVEEILAHVGREITDPTITIITDDKSIKIAQVRQLQSDLAVAYSGTKPRLVLLTPANRITTAAQQALLKLVEEPPAHTQIVLAAPNTQEILPTIVSRCQVEVTQGEGRTLSNSSDLSGKTLWQQLLSLDLKGRVVLTQSLPTDRQVALGKLQAELQALRTVPATEALVAWQQRCLTTMDALRHNVNVGLGWEYLVLG